MLHKVFPLSIGALALCCALGISCHKSNPITPPPPGHTALTLRATFISTRWTQLAWNNDSTAASHTYVLLRDGRDTVFCGTSMKDTLSLIDSALTPGTSYAYNLYRIVNNQHWDSASVTVRTLDTTKDDYQWETTRIGAAGSVLYGVWGSSPNSVWMCGAGDVGGGNFFNVVHDSNGALSYMNLNGGGPTFNGCYGTSDSSVYFVGLATLAHYDGHAFDYVYFYGDSAPVHAGNLYSVWATPDDREIFAVGDNGTIVHRKPDGTWEVQPSGTTLTLVKVIGFGSHDVYACGGESNYEGIILHYDGTTWHEIAHGYLPPPADTTLLVGAIDDIGGQSADSLYSVGQRIFKRAGDQWILPDAPWNARNNAAGGAREGGVAGTWNNMWVVGDYGLVMHYNGERWTANYPFYDLGSTRSFGKVLPFSNEVFITGDDAQSAILLRGR